MKLIALGLVACLGGALAPCQSQFVRIQESGPVIKQAEGMAEMRLEMFKHEKAAFVIALPAGYPAHVEAGAVSDKGHVELQVDVDIPDRKLSIGISQSNRSASQGTDSSDLDLIREAASTIKRTLGVMPSAETPFVHEGRPALELLVAEDEFHIKAWLIVGQAQVFSISVFAEKAEHIAAAPIEAMFRSFQLK